MVDLFHQSTISRQAQLLSRQLGNTGVVNDEPDTDTHDSTTSEIEDEFSQEDPAPVKQERDIAIIGMAGKFPGANDPDELYENLMDGRSGIQEFRGHNGDLNMPEGCIWIPRAGTLSGVEDFDHAFWKLTREEATDMDPQQRLFLKVAFQALEDANIDTSGNNKRKVGIFVGAAANKYHTVTEAVYGDPFQRANRGFVAPCISARTAYHLNLYGPNVTINTNCASSTVAVTLAVDALRNGRCDVAVVGGVSVQLLK